MSDVWNKICNFAPESCETTKDKRMSTQTMQKTIADYFKTQLSLSLSLSLSLYEH